MKVLAAYLLVALGGKTPVEADVKKVLSSVGVEADAAEVTKVFAELNGKDLNTLIAEGSKKLAAVPSGGAAAPAAAAAGGAKAAAAAPAAAAAAPKKEEKKEESDEDMGFGLFD